MAWNVSGDSGTTNDLTLLLSNPSENHINPEIKNFLEEKYPITEGYLAGSGSPQSKVLKNMISDTLLKGFEFENVADTIDFEKLLGILFETTTTHLAKQVSESPLFDMAPAEAITLPEDSDEEEPLSTPYVNLFEI